MEKKEAEQILREKKEKESAEIEAQKTIREAKLKEQQEKEEVEKKAKKQEFEEMQKSFPKKCQEIFCKCWKCKKEINMSQGEHIAKSTRIIIVAGCKCGAFNVAVIPTNTTISSDHERFLPEDAKKF